jgi:hypothetical protein
MYFSTGIRKELLKQSYLPMGNGKPLIYPSTSLHYRQWMVDPKYPDIQPNVSSVI